MCGLLCGRRGLVHVGVVFVLCVMSVVLVLCVMGAIVYVAGVVLCVMGLVLL